VHIGNHLKGEIEILHTKTVFQNEYIAVYNDDVIFPSGYQGTYLRLGSPTPSSVAVLPIRSDGRFCLIKNYRHGARGWCLELIKGGMEQGETLEQAALREMEEEAGLHAGRFTFAGSYSDSPAVMSGSMHCFFAHNITPSCRKEEKTEAISEVLFFNRQEYKEACRDMDFVDGMTELMVYKYASGEGCP
jgi:ADP-ribose pyrophosphatase